MNSEEEAWKNPIEELQYNHVLSQCSGSVPVITEREEVSGRAYDRENILFSVSRFLIKACVPAHLKGYHYLREAIVMTVIDPDNINAVTKKLYPVIAKKYKTTSVCVERAIRHAIQIAWFREECAPLRNRPGVMVRVFKVKPTNSSFIAEIAEKIRFELLTESADD
ncbi:Stage 0 sporulation protein A [bioreactor metagenome]|uniref:Stage 0 sporulation protein A n=1 Tax=bioreactor metagenome TaxID=1076179 RepID=A0A644WT27_9ZZZZ